MLRRRLSSTSSQCDSTVATERSRLAWSGALRRGSSQYLRLKRVWQQTHNQAYRAGRAKKPVPSGQRTRRQAANATNKPPAIAE
jgi:hypothetical protein